MKPAERIDHLGSAIFTVLDDMRKEAIAKGTKVINLSIGSPDLPPAQHIIDALQQGIADSGNYGYPLSRGVPGFLDSVAQWYDKRFGVKLNPSTEVTSLMGSQDGLAHICLCFVNPGDYVLIPDPGYPIYSAGPGLAGGIIHPMPLTAENKYLPDFDAIPLAVAQKAKVMVLNYPSNPVTAVANAAFFQKAIAYAKKYDIIICHDIAYSELAFDGYRPDSFLSVDGAFDVGIEFHSLSKTYNMAGCRLGFAVGNPMVIEMLAKLKSNIDYGVFLPVQKAGIAALTGPQEEVSKTAQTYQRRRDLFLRGVTLAGWHIVPPKATMFIWAPVPKPFNSMEFATKLLTEAGVLVVPGHAFGKYGEGFVRIALVTEDEILQEAITRIQRFFKKHNLSTEC